MALGSPCEALVHTAAPVIPAFLPHPANVVSSLKTPVSSVFSKSWRRDGQSAIELNPALLVISCVTQASDLDFLNLR